MQSSVPSRWRYSITRTQCTHPPSLFIYLPPSTAWNHTPTTHALTLRITTHHAYNLVQHSINNVKCSMLGYFAHNKIWNIRRHKGRRTVECWRICEWTGPSIDTHTQYNLFYNAHRHRQHLPFWHTTSIVHLGIHFLVYPALIHLIRMASTCSSAPQYVVTVINFHP